MHQALNLEFMLLTCSEKWQAGNLNSKFPKVPQEPSRSKHTSAGRKGTYSRKKLEPQFQTFTRKIIECTSKEKTTSNIVRYSFEKEFNVIYMEISR